MTTTGQANSYPYLFGGMELDSSGLYHTQSRYYSPTFGRFLSADSRPSSNPFAYVGDNPINAIDPTGEYAETPPVCAGWCKLAEDAVVDIVVKSIETGDILKGIEAFLQSTFDPGNIFGDWFGGGGSQPIIPPSYYRHVHYPAGQFIGVSKALEPAEGDSAQVEGPDSQGGNYIDLNLSFGAYVMGTVGLQIGPKGDVHVYGGGGAGYGASASIMQGSGEVTPGWQAGFQMQYLGPGVQMGFSKDGPFAEKGGGYGSGMSGTVYYVSGTLFTLPPYSIAAYAGPLPPPPPWSDMALVP